MSNEVSVYVHGESGRIGSAFYEAIEINDNYRHADTSENAHIVGLCVPSHVGTTLLNQVLKEQLVIDFSGAAKQAHMCNYGLVNSGGNLWTPPVQEQNVYGNPGCMAAAVLLGIEQSGIIDHIKSSLSITAIGGKDYSPSGSDGELWVARRTYEHPHVAEIERSLESYGVSVASFVPIISQRTKSGLLVSISGELAESYSKINYNKKSVDVKSVVGSDKISYRLEAYPDSSGVRRFMLHVAIDNTLLIVANALRLMDIVARHP